MATEITVDRGGLDGFDWDSQSVGLYAAAGLLGDSTGGAAKRAGVVPAVGTPLKYLLSAGLVGNLKAGVFAIPAPDTSLGVHFAVLPADFLITHTTAHGSQPRTDLIIVELNDVGTPSSTAKFRLLTGTAGSGAPAPALPTSLGNGAAFTLASVLINATATTLTSITDQRVFTASAGGMVPVATTAATTGLPTGTPFYELVNGRSGVKTAAGYDLSSAGKLRQQIPAVLATGGAVLPNNNASTSITDQSITVLEQSLVEWDLRANIVTSGNAAGYLDVTIGTGAMESYRWHSHNLATVLDVGRVFKFRATSAGAVNCHLAIRVDSTGGSVTVYDLNSNIRELI